MMRIARLCKTNIQFNKYRAQLPQIILQYEIYGRIMVLYNVKIILLGTISFNLFNTPIVREVLVQISSTCSFHVKLSSIWTPRNLVEFTICVSVSVSVWFISYFIVANRYLYCTITYFLVFRFEQHITCFV